MATLEQLRPTADSETKDSSGPWASLVRRWRQSRFANRRRHRRYEVDAAIEVASDGLVRFRALANISSSGALLVPPLDCPVGARVRLTTRHLPMALSGKVVGHFDQGTGIEFESTLSGSFATLWFNSVGKVASVEPKR